MELIRPTKFETEGERRFWVKRMPRFYIENECQKEITQWYICLDPPIRVRVENFDDCYLTIKIGDEPGKDYELEVSIPKLALPMLATARKHNEIRKTRHPVSNLNLDVFLPSLAGLVLMEFEKKLEGDIPKIPLDFSVVEVTGDPRFRNHNLAKLDSVPEDWKCVIV